MTKSDEKKPTNKSRDAEKLDASADAGQAQVQAQMDTATEQGYHGIKVDPTPDAHYTVEGVTSGKPTPETDPALAAQAKASAAAGTNPKAG